MSDETANKCVYFHLKPNGDVFYVGLGSHNRSREFHARNIHWKRVVAKHGEPSVKIVSDGLTSSQAGEVEQFWIAVFGYENLANMSHGGEGAAGAVKSDECRRKIGDAQRGEKNHAFGRHLTDEHRKKIGDANRGEQHHSYDDTVYTFAHEDHGVIECTRNEMRTKFNLSSVRLHDLFRGERQSANGWRLLEEGVEVASLPKCFDGRRDSSEYDFIHPEHGIVRATKYDIRMRYGLNPGHINSLTRGRVPSHKGWRLLVAANDNTADGMERANG